MDGRDKLAAVGLGALGGGVIAFAAWQAMRTVVDQQVQTSVRTAVDDEIAHKLAEVGITPAVAANLNTLMTNLDNLGVFSALAAGTTSQNAGTRGRR